MIKLLGFKRTLILGILLGVNALLGVIYLLWASPQTAALNTQLMGLRSEISNLQTGIQNTKTDMQMLEQNLPTYDMLIKKGFMQEQDRFVMSRALEDIKAKSHVQGFSFSVGDIREITNADAQLAGKRLLHSRVQLNSISSPLDINVFDMVRLIETEYPVHARISSFKISREGALNQERIDAMVEAPVSLVASELVFDWFSMSDIPQAVTPGVPGGM